MHFCRGDRSYDTGLGGGKTYASIDKYHIFIVIMASVKLLLMGLFSSDYQNEFFMPFAAWFIEHGGNPYEHFMNEGIRAFPYPPVMLLLESAGAALVKLCGGNSVFMSSLLFKLPCLFMDFLGLHFLVRLFPLKRRYAAVVWFASPVVLYAVYMHGQLDLIPTVFLLGSVYFISSKDKHRNLKGMLFLILALLSKLHILAALPLMLLYLYKRDGLSKTVGFAAGSLFGMLVGMAPFLSDGFCRMVLFNEEQRAVTYSALRFASVEVYAVIAAAVVLYMSAFRVNMINRNLLFSMCGMIFAVFLILCPPMPGWYVWVLPYITFFFMDVDMERYKNIAIYMFLNLLYLLYFVFFHSRDITDLYVLAIDLSCLKISSPVWRNIIFTMLTGALIYIVGSMYRLGITSNSYYKRKNIPFTIGVAGDSGTGKSTFIALVKQALGAEDLLYIEGDGDHRWERGNAQWQEFTHLNPKANYLYRQARDLRQLRLGNAVRRVDYDHDAGIFTDAKRIRPKSYVILCGLHAMYLPQTRKYLDLKIYMDVDENLRRHWKIQRDMEHRGYSKESILRQIEERIPDAVKYIYPQKQYADILICYYDNTLQEDVGQAHTDKISLRMTVSAAMDVEALVDELGMYGMMVSHDYSQDLRKQTIEIDAEELGRNVLAAEAIAGRIIPQLEEITKETFVVDNDMDAVVVLMLFLCISSKMRGEI